VWVGADPQGVAVDVATNSIYVANRGSDSVSVLT
jgi:DNA-binding beta-propeller fold protein YncE